MTQVVQASVYVDDEEDDPDLAPERGRWLADVDIPGQRTFTVRAKYVGGVINYLDKWGRDRGVAVEVKFLRTIGGGSEEKR